MNGDGLRCGICGAAALYMWPGGGARCKRHREVLSQGELEYRRKIEARHSAGEAMMKDRDRQLRKQDNRRSRRGIKRKGAA